MNPKNLLLFCCIFFFFTAKAQQPLATTFRPFITTWNTAIMYGSNPGGAESAPNQIIFKATGSNYKISWVNMNNASDTGSQTGSVVDTITFATQGIYKVYITPGNGTFTAITPYIFFDEVGEEFSDNIKLLSIEQWGDIQWTTFNSAFKGCENMVLNAADTPLLSNVTDLSDMFYGCTSLTTNAAMNNWNTSHITNMAAMFFNAQSFNQPIGNWNVSNVTDMGNMFGYALLFNQPIGNWNVSNVNGMGDMFYDAQSFNQPIGNWNVSNVTDMGQMFSDAYAFNQPIGNWNVGKVISMLNMFSAAKSFNQPIGNWNVSNVTDMTAMFAGISLFRDNPSTIFNQNINNWNVGKVISMYEMFYRDHAFNQNIGGWSLNRKLQMIGTLDSTGMDCYHYSLTLKGWAGNKLTPDSLFFSTIGLTYDSVFAQAAHDSLTNIKEWVISGDTAKHCSGILPVNFISFNAIQQGNIAQLNWKVAKEINAKGYDVEKSGNGYNYNSIGFVNADAKQTSYAYTDNKLSDGTSYYRIKEIDNDGKYMYSTIRKIEYSKFAWKVIGNPVKNSSVELMLDKTANISIQVVSSNGNIIKTMQKGNLIGGSYNIPLNIDNISSGLYLVRLMVDDKAYSATVIK